VCGYLPAGSGFQLSGKKTWRIPIRDQAGHGLLGDQVMGLLIKPVVNCSSSGK
jgi:hypothetical protein